MALDDIFAMKQEWVAVSCALIILLASQMAIGGSRNAIATKIDYFRGFGSLGFQDLCHQARIPCGLEEAASGLHAQSGEWLEAKGETVMSILNRLIAGPMKGYGWKNSEGVIAMMPKTILAEKETSSLDKKISAIDIVDLPVSAAALRICEQAGVATLHQVLEGEKGRLYGHVSIHLRDTTVREALNAVVRKDGQSLWHVAGASGNRVIQIETYRVSHKGSRDDGQPLRKIQTAIPGTKL